MDVSILSAGAAKGIVTALQPAFRARTGIDIQAMFGAVGAMLEKLRGGEPCDVIILTAAMIDDLERAGDVLSGSGAPLGRVRTGIAVREGEALPDISDGDALRQTLSAAAALYVPDPQRATAGIHFLKVLERLEIERHVAPRLRAFPNGATAMRELAHSNEKGAVGCTQITEIRYTPGVTLVGALPAEFELATVYSAAVCNRSRQPEIARQFVALLTGAESRALRLEGGFER